jgi:hypothetical protein
MAAPAAGRLPGRSASTVRLVLFLRTTLHLFGVVVLIGRFSFWLCAVLLGCGQVASHAQLFLVAGRSGTNPPDPGMVALGWNPSPDPRATGYFLCWGLASGACTNLLDAGSSTSATVAGLATNVTYYFSVVTYGAGPESPPSNEIAYAVPGGSPAAVGPRLGMRFGGTGAGAVERFSFLGSAGAIYDLQASQDLQQWETLWTTNCASDGLIVFDETDMGIYPSRFYRLQQR